MNILIDTHIFLWSLASPDKIEPARLNELESPINTVYVSSVTIAELMIKTSIGKLNINFNPKEMALKSGFKLLDFNADDALLLKELPFHHKDPFDRMLISQSISRKYTLMTNDKKIKQYSCTII